MMSLDGCMELGQLIIRWMCVAPWYPGGMLREGSPTLRWSLDNSCHRKYQHMLELLRMPPALQLSFLPLLSSQNQCFHKNAV